MGNFAAEFLARAATSGGRTAIERRDEAVTYAELARASRAFAAHLRAGAFAPGDRVAIAADDSWQFAAAFYGTLVAGGVAVPLSASARAPEYSEWLRHSAATWLVLDSGNGEARAAAEGMAVRPVLVNSEDVPGRAEANLRNIVATARADAEVAVVAPSSPAALMYTSGTTGRPKGVLLSHGNLAANYSAIVASLALGADDCIVTVLPFCHAYGASVLHTHLLVGARVIVEEGFVYPHQVIATAARVRATGFAGVPSTYALLLARVRLADFDLASLRYLTQAGGPMPAAVAERVRDALPHAALHVMYGQTEATARLTCRPPSAAAFEPGCVGPPLAGIDLEIRDEEGRPLACDAVGQVWARGPNVMLGYWRDESATAAALRDGWLCTGDVGRLDACGQLHLVGRRSDIVKVGAHRVHPSDVESAIAELPFVAEVAVAGVPDDLLGEVVKAWIVAAPGASVDVRALKQHCRARLASYKIPKHVEVVAALPRTASGKVRRAALAAQSLEEQRA